MEQETWRHRLLFKISREYHKKLPKDYCNSDLEIYLLLQIGITQMGTNNFHDIVINRKQCSGFFTNLSNSPYEYSNKNIKSTIQIKPEIK